MIFEKSQVIDYSGNRQVIDYSGNSQVIDYSGNHHLIYLADKCFSFIVIEAILLINSCSKLFLQLESLIGFNHTDYKSYRAHHITTSLDNLNILGGRFFGRIFVGY